MKVKTESEVAQSKASKSDKDNHHIISLIFGLSKKDTHDLIYKNETGSQT